MKDWPALIVVSVGAVLYAILAFRPELIVRCEPLPLHRRVKAHALQRFRPNRS